MPLPWLIGAAVAAATAAVIKAVSDDDSSSSPSSSSSSSNAAERQKQEREAARQRERGTLEARLATHRKSQLDEANAFLEGALKSLDRPFETAAELSSEKFQQALKTEKAANFKYAQRLSATLRRDDTARHGCPPKELKCFLNNLQVLQDLYSPTPQPNGASAGKAVDRLMLRDAEQKALASIEDSVGRIEHLQRLKQQLEQQG